MRNHKLIFLIVVACFLAVCFGANECQGQEPAAVFQKAVLDKVAFAESDLTALDQGETVIRLLPTRDKREIAISGMVRLQAPAEMFLQSFRENMTSKNNSAILEIGRFSNLPSFEDLQALTIEDRDIEDLRQCLVGDCQVKLSAMMIGRLQKEIDWAAPNYRVQVSQLLKQMFVEYVRDYLARGDAALIQYDDKPSRIRLADELHELLAASRYDALAETKQAANDFSTSELALVENAFVWSKIKFGLKPVIAINHIMIYKRTAKVGAEILVVSKQIYANHYFDSSLALTAFLNAPSPTPKSYLLYENRSRVDGLEGPFSKIKRGFIEQRAISSLESILLHSQKNLNARAMNLADSSVAQVGMEQTSRRWKLGRVLPLLILFLSITALTVWAVRAHDWTGHISRSAH
jgi:hypothetical protein